MRYASIDQLPQQHRESARRQLAIQMPAPFHVRLEHDEAVDFFRWVTENEQRYPELEMVWHNPNGGDRHKAVAAKLKAEGVRKGVPDYTVAVPRNGYHGMFLELKRVKGGVVSDDQRKMMEALTAQGFWCIVGNGAEHAIDELCKYLGIE